MKGIVGFIHLIFSIIVLMSVILICIVLTDPNIYMSFSKDLMLIGIMIIVGAYVLRNRFKFYFHYPNYLKIRRKLQIKNFKESIFFIFFFVLITLLIFGLFQIGWVYINQLINSNIMIVSISIILLLGIFNSFLFRKIERVENGFLLENNSDKILHFSSFNKIIVYQDKIEFKLSIDGLENNVVVLDDPIVSNEKAIHSFFQPYKIEGLGSDE